MVLGTGKRTKSGKDCCCGVCICDCIYCPKGAPQTFTLISSGWSDFEGLPASLFNGTFTLIRADSCIWSIMGVDPSGEFPYSITIYPPGLGPSFPNWTLQFVMGSDFSYQFISFTNPFNCCGNNTLPALSPDTRPSGVPASVQLNATIPPGFVCECCPICKCCTPNPQCLQATITVTSGGVGATLPSTFILRAGVDTIYDHGTTNPPLIPECVFGGSFNIHIMGVASGPCIWPSGDVPVEVSFYCTSTATLTLTPPNNCWIIMRVGGGSPITMGPYQGIHTCDPLAVTFTGPFFFDDVIDNPTGSPPCFEITEFSIAITEIDCPMEMMERSPTKEVVPDRISLACIHLQDFTGEEITCQTCKGNTRIKTFGCKLYQKCTTHTAIESLTCCQNCPSYKASSLTYREKLKL